MVTRHPARPVLTVAAIRALESRLLSPPVPQPLMEMAGDAVARLALEILAGKRRVWIVAGPGNNGGDALVAATLLKNSHCQVEVTFSGEAIRLSPEAQSAHAAWLAAGGTCHAVLPSDEAPDLIVDGLFGIGLDREVTGAAAELIEAINALRTPVLSIDVPSGLCAATGNILGHAVNATHTLSFFALKPGLLTLDGPDQCGMLHVESLGVPADSLTEAGRTLEPHRQAILPARRRNVHKGHFGHLLILGGAPGLRGAALLAGRAALRSGTGRVTVAMPDATNDLDSLFPELMICPATHALDTASWNTLVAGPGLGQSPEAGRLLQRALAFGRPTVLDADALNLLAGQPWPAHHPAPLLLTPHPLEAARLLGCSIEVIQADRLGSAQKLASRYRAWIALKGVGTICAGPDGRWWINTTGNPGLASAGMGDVLAGLAGSLLAQGLTPADALTAAVCLHGQAADEAATAGYGPIGLSSQELIEFARRRINRY